MSFYPHNGSRIARTVILAISLGLIGTGIAQGALTLTGPLNLSHASNLVQNGSFEDQPSGGSPYVYWANGSTSGPVVSPANWVTSGGPANYALWGDTTVGIFSAPVPDGNSALYFGNGTLSTISTPPTFNGDGTVSFGSTPTFTSTYSPEVTLSQTLTGLNTGATYGLSFWVSGEDATNPVQQFPFDGVFGLDVTGFSTAYLTVPSSHSALGTSHIYNFTFTPLVANTTIAFTNWGHFTGNTIGWPFAGPTGNPQPGWSTELILDDVIVNQVPEPSSLILFGLAAGGLLGRIRRRHESTKGPMSL